MSDAIRTDKQLIELRGKIQGAPKSGSPAENLGTFHSDGELANVLRRCGEQVYECLSLNVKTALVGRSEEPCFESLEFMGRKERQTISTRNTFKHTHTCINTFYSKLYIYIYYC